MNNRDFLIFTHNIIHNATNILSAKGHDYSSNDDRLINFKRVAKSFSTLTGKEFSAYDAALYIQLIKIDRINNLTLSGKTPNNESIMDSMIDEFNYLLLKYACLQEIMNGNDKILDKMRKI